MKNVFCQIAAMLLLSGCTSPAERPAETIPGRDYQRCLDAEQMGGGSAIASRCGKLSREIEQNGTH